MDRVKGGTFQAAHSYELERGASEADNQIWQIPDTCLDLRVSLGGISKYEKGVCFLLFELKV